MTGGCGNESTYKNFTCARGGEGQNVWRCHNTDIDRIRSYYSNSADFGACGFSEFKDRIADEPDQSAAGGIYT